VNEFLLTAAPIELEYFEFARNAEIFTTKFTNLLK